MKKIIHFFLWCIFIGAILFVLFSAVSLSDIKIALRALSGGGIALIVGLVLAIKILQGTRFFFILRAGNNKITWLQTMKIFIASHAFTPLPGGEVGRAMLLKREGNIPFHEGVGPVFLQALMELWTATLLSLLVIYFVGSSFGGWWLVGFFGLLFILTIPLLCSKQLVSFFDLLKNHGVTYKWIEKTQTTLRCFNQLISSQGKKSAWRFWALLILLGLFAHVLNGILLWYVVFVIGAHVTMLQALFAAAMTVLIQGIFAIIPGGLGVTEGGLVGILLGFTVIWKQAIAITLIYRMATFPLSILIAFLCLAFMYGKKYLHALSIKPTVS